jgi:hypothetical protein
MQIFHVLVFESKMWFGGKDDKSRTRTGDRRFLRSLVAVSLQDRLQNKSKQIPDKKDSSYCKHLSLHIGDNMKRDFKKKESSYNNAHTSSQKKETNMKPIVLMGRQIWLKNCQRVEKPSVGVDETGRRLMLPGRHSDIPYVTPCCSSRMNYVPFTVAAANISLLFVSYRMI